MDIYTSTFLEGERRECARMRGYKLITGNSTKNPKRISPRRHEGHEEHEEHEEIKLRVLRVFVVNKSECIGTKTLKILNASMIHI
jgi:hypothetical protein